MDTAQGILATVDSPDTTRMRMRTRFGVMALTLLLSLLTAGLIGPKADAASQTMQPFGQHVSCYNGYFATTAVVYPGAFSSNGYLDFPTQRAYYYAVTPAGSNQPVKSGWISNPAYIDTMYLSGGPWDFWLYTYWTDPGLGNQWTSTGGYVYLGRCY